MPVHKFNEYLQLINVIQAEKALLDINVVAYPVAKKDYQKKLQRQLKSVFTNTVKPVQVLKDYKDVVANLARKMHGR